MRWDCTKKREPKFALNNMTTIILILDDLRLTVDDCFTVRACRNKTDWQL